MHQIVLIALWEASWELPARIWQEMADFTSENGLWEASWELLARIWQEIANFTSKTGLWEASWELLAQDMAGNGQFYL